MTGALGGDQNRTDAFGEVELAVVVVEAVGADEDITRREVVANLAAEDVALNLVGQKDRNEVALLDRFLRGNRREAVP